MKNDHSRRLLLNALCAASILGGGQAFAPFTPRSLVVGSHSRSFVSSTRNRGFTLEAARSNVAESTVMEKSSTATLAPPKPTETPTDGVATLIVDDSSSSEIAAADAAEANNDEYKRGFATIAFITFLNASLSPVWHVVFEGNGPPPLFLNAVVSTVALVGLLGFGPFLDSSVSSTAALKETDGDEVKWGMQSFRGGIELGLWKGLGTTCHIYGMALTTANHGAFLLQLTTLIVPVLQGLRGAERIPRQIQAAVALALAGIYAFTQDPTGASDVVGDPSMIQMGDALVLGAAFFYSIYDIQTFYWGREVPRTELVTIKVGFQAVLSVILCAFAARPETMEYLQSSPDWPVFIPTVLWTGLIVNALATFLQVGGMQAVGPTRAQTIFASQPLWASIMNYFFLGATMGLQGFVGGGSFLGALFLAATAEAPTPVLEDDDDDVLEVKMADGSTSS